MNKFEKFIKEMGFNPYYYWSYLLTKYKNRGVKENEVSILIITGPIF